MEKNTVETVEVVEAMDTKQDLAIMDGFKPVVDYSMFNFDEESARPSITVFETETEEDEIKIFNAINNPTGKISDYINKQITLVGFHMDIVDLADEDTGVLEPCPRIVLITDKDETIQAVSFGVLNSMKRIKKQFGARLSKGIVVEVKQQATKNGSMLLLNVVAFKK